MTGCDGKEDLPMTAIIDVDAHFEPGGDWLAIALLALAPVTVVESAKLVRAAAARARGSRTA